MPSPEPVQEGSIVWGFEAERLGCREPAMVLPGGIVFTYARLKAIVAEMGTKVAP